MEWKIEPREGVEAFVSQGKYLVIRNQHAEDGEGVCVHVEDLPRLIEIINQAREYIDVDASCEAEASRI